MSKIEYTVVSDTVLDEFCAKVAELMNEGWEPVGGVSVSNWMAGNNVQVSTEYVQAMVRRAKSAGNT
jgi:hypothetical protein